MWRPFLLSASLVATPHVARADAGAPSPALGAAVPSPERMEPLLEAPVPGPGLRTLGVLASVFPGAILHGAGHWVIGRDETAARLLLLDGVGVALIAAGAIPLAFTRANRYLTGPFATLAIVGGAMFSTSWIVDTTAVAWPLETRGQPRRDAARVAGELGYRYVHHRAFDRQHAAVARLDTRFGPLRLSPELWSLPQTSESRWRLEGAYRAWGPLGTVPSGDGSWLELALGAGRHRFAELGFALVTADAMAQARVDWAQLDPNLRGFFFELGLGVGWQRTSFDEAPDDDNTLLLGRFASGLWIGDPTEGAWAEMLIAYDQRHDTIAGGVTEIGLGIPGFFQFDTRIWPTAEAGLRLHAEAGAAIVAGGSLLVRGLPGGGDE